MSLKYMKLTLRKFVFFITFLALLLIVLINSYLKNDFRTQSTEFFDTNFYGKNNLSLIKKGKNR
jgi:hypothetical protein